MGDVRTTTIVSDAKNILEDPSNSLSRIIIKKGNFGLGEYQHKNYQYGLLNNRIKHHQYYEDLVKTKDRLEKPTPTMQQVIHTDMKRISTNEVYERQLGLVLNGPRGLNWQCKQQLKRLKSGEHDIERDLIRLNREMTRISVSSSLSGYLSSHENEDRSRSQMSRLAFRVPIHPTPQKAKVVLLNRSLLISTSEIAANYSTSINHRQTPLNTHLYSYREKPPCLRQQIMFNARHNHPRVQKHAHIINQEKQLIEEKLKEFLH